MNMIFAIPLKSLKYKTQIQEANYSFSNHQRFSYLGSIYPYHFQPILTSRQSLYEKWLGIQHLYEPTAVIDCLNNQAHVNPVIMIILWVIFTLHLLVSVLYCTALNVCVVLIPPAPVVELSMDIYIIYTVPIHYHLFFLTFSGNKADIIVRKHVSKELAMFDIKNL